MCGPGFNLSAGQAHQEHFGQGHLNSALFNPVFLHWDDFREKCQEKYVCLELSAHSGSSLVVDLK